MKWRLAAVPPAALELARLLSRLPGMVGFYLAGGTALALQRGHRISVDLDFFSAVNPLGENEREALKSELARLPEFRVRGEAEGTLHVLLAGVEVSFLRYRYPLLRRPLRWRGLAVASQTDIGLMKIGAIIGRGSRKDFRDLREIVRALPLENLLKLSRKKFPDAEDFLFQAARALVYFADADAGQDPRLIRGEPWEDIRSFFEREAPRAFRRLSPGL